MTARPVEDNAPIAGAMALVWSAEIATLGLLLALTSPDSAMAFQYLPFFNAGAGAAVLF
jgi:hypothetical protein